MNPIIAVEDHITGIARDMLGSHRGTVESLASALNLTILKKIIAGNKSPGVYVVFLGGPKGRTCHINARFDVYVIVRHSGNHIARRRGDSTTVGAYNLVAGLIPKLDGSTINEVGTLSLKGVKNLFSMQIEEAFNAALYAITFELPNMPFPDEFDPTTLDDFITYHGEHSMAPGDDEPAAIDNVTLEQ